MNQSLISIPRIRILSEDWLPSASLKEWLGQMLCSKFRFSLSEVLDEASKKLGRQISDLGGFRSGEILVGCAGRSDVWTSWLAGGRWQVAAARMMGYEHGRPNGLDDLKVCKTDGSTTLFRVWKETITAKKDIVGKRLKQSFHRCRFQIFQI